MKQYIGTKIVNAEPMIKDNTDGYKVVYPDGYESWSPKDVFDDAYNLTYGMSFGLAIEAMKKGHKVSRSGWNGKDMWITISDNLNGKPLEADKFWNPHSRQAAIDNGGSMEVLPAIIMKTADSKILMGWLASQTDMLSNDWGIK